MNTTEYYVTEVLSQPYQVEPFSHWFVKVMANSWGYTSENLVMVKTNEEAVKVGVGYKFDT